MPGGLRSGRKGRLENLQLFRLYGRSWASPLRPGTAVSATTTGTAVWTFVLRLAIPRFGISIQRTFDQCKQTSLIIDPAAGQTLVSHGAPRPARVALRRSVLISSFASFPNLLPPSLRPPPLDALGNLKRITRASLTNCTRVHACMIRVSRNLDRPDRGNNNRSQSPGSDAKPPSDYRGCSTLESYTLYGVCACARTQHSFRAELFAIIYIYPGRS